MLYPDRFTTMEINEKGKDIEREIPFLKGYTVLNVEQIEGLLEHYYATPDRGGATSRELRQMAEAHSPRATSPLPLGKTPPRVVRTAAMPRRYAACLLRQQTHRLALRCMRRAPRGTGQRGECRVRRSDEAIVEHSRSPRAKEPRDLRGTFRPLAALHPAHQ